MKRLKRDRIAGWRPSPEELLKDGQRCMICDEKASKSECHTEARIDPAFYCKKCYEGCVHPAMKLMNEEWKKKARQS